MNTTEDQTLQFAKTCNEVAAILFPDCAKVGPAFVEYENGKLNECPYLELLDLNDDFWALALKYTVYLADDSQFHQFDPESGLYAPVTESTLIGQIITNLNLCSPHFPSRLKHDSFLALKNRTHLKSVVERAKDLLSVGECYFRNLHSKLNFSNGIFNLGDKTFNQFSHTTPLLDKMPVKYDPVAKCDIFLKSFLAHILEPNDIDLLQRYLSQVLQGINHSQKILVLSGDAGWGKSSLMKILGQIVGWNRIGIIRDQLYRNESELSHYANKHLLYHPDMPTQFLNLDQANIFKQLVGGDPLWAELKDGARLILEGNFPLVLACNGRPQIKIDQDVDAWARRLIVLNFKKPAHDKHFGKMAELLFEKEGSGILNWLLEGRRKLVKDNLQLTMTQEQQARTTMLLLGSESPSAFVRSRLVKQKEGVMGAVEMYENYQEWCREHGLEAFSSKQFHKIAKRELEIGFGLRYRHDLASETGGVMRGWKGLALVETSDFKNGSKESEEQVFTE